MSCSSIAQIDLTFHDALILSDLSSLDVANLYPEIRGFEPTGGAKNEDGVLILSFSRKGKRLEIQQKENDLTVWYYTKSNKELDEFRKQAEEFGWMESEDGSIWSLIPVDNPENLERPYMLIDRKSQWHVIHVNF
jgi:hypothetical protein